MLDHLEVVGKGLPLEQAPLPFVALPTTAGTGSEVTKNAVIGVPEHGRKVSLRDKRMLANLAVVDPALTDNTPRSVTLASGLDAVTQVIEPYVSCKANRLTDALCRDAIPQGLHALVTLMDGEDAYARDDLAWTSLCGGLALANSGLGAVHGLAGVIGGMTTAPHGAVCGALLPHVLMANIAAHDLPAQSRRRLERVRNWIASALMVAPETAFERLAEWSQHHGLPTLGEMGVEAKDIERIAEASVASSSMKGNPVPLSVGQLANIQRAAF
jgi:alcohol dehydrogenase class IV